MLANSLYSFHLLFSRPRIEVVLYAHIFIFCLNCRAVHKNFQEATQHKGFLGDYVKVGEKKVPYIESNHYFFLNLIMVFLKYKALSKLSDLNV